MGRSVRCAIALASLVVVAPLYASGTMAKLKKIENANTIIVDLRGKETTVRLYGIASAEPSDPRPNIQKLAVEAKEFLGEYMKSGWVYLEFPQGQPVADKDGVVPALVYRDRDAAFVNEKLVGAGLGVVSEEAAGEWKDRFLKRQIEARAASAGLWGEFVAGHAKKLASGEAHEGKYIGETSDELGDFYAILYWLRRVHMSGRYYY